MKLIFSFVFVCFIDSVWATNYYFSSISGNDSRTSTQAKNPSTPWKTISKLNSFFRNLKPGDQVLFKRGETFYGGITIGSSGKAGSPIVIGAYGKGEKPVITSLVKLSGWKANSRYKGVYNCAVNSKFGSEVNIVLLNDIVQQIGRYPNINAANKGYLTFESHGGRSSITDKKLPRSPNWKGAELVLRTAHWIIDRRRITSISGGRINFTPNSTYKLRNKYGYFIQNDIRTLDQFGEWYYNPSKKIISMYFGGKKPSSYDVKATSVNNLIYSSRKSYIVIDNITFKGANEYGVDINRGSNVTVKNCSVIFSGIDGVAVSSNNYFNLESCNVSSSNNNGVITSGSNVTVRNNTIKDSYTIAGMGRSGNGKGVGLRVNSKGLAEYNTIVNSGYIGIDYTGNDLLIKNNLVNTFAFIKDDGGGIYSSNPTKITNKGRKIIGNIILNGIGAPEGTVTSNSSADGIYMDFNVNGTEITGNTIANCNRGFFLHDCQNLVIKNNTSFDNNNGQLHMKTDWLGRPIRNQTITNNIFFSKHATQTVASIITVHDDKDIAKMGRFDNNYYARPIDDRLVFFNTTFYNSRKEYRVNRDLEGWKAKYRLDASSKRSAKKIATHSETKLIGSNKLNDGSFNRKKTVSEIWANNCSITWQNAGMMEGGYLKVRPSAASSSIVLSVGAISSSKKYILKYTVKGSGNMSIGANLRSSDFNLLTPIQYRTVSSNRTENQIMFTPSSSATRKGALVFTVDAKSTYYLNDIQLYEANATITNPDDSIKFVYNPSQVDKNFPLNGDYIDVKNNKYSGSITLAPYTSAVLIRNTGSTTKRSALSVSIINPNYNANFNGPASIKIAAAVTGKNGTIRKVEFYNGSKLLETIKKTPYNFTWRNVSAGKYIITAKATDNDSRTATSDKVLITVSATNRGGLPPTVNITTKDNKRVFSHPADIYIRASANSPSGIIEKVNFYRGNRLLGTQSKYPFAITWRDVAVGTYTIKAVATDNNGRSVTSAPVTVKVVKKSKSTNRRPTSVNIATQSDNIAAETHISGDQASLRISPNPVSTTLNISTKGLSQNKPLTISVVSASGGVIKTIQSNSSTQTIPLNVSTLQRGVYFIKIIYENKVLSQQFVKL